LGIREIELVRDGYDKVAPAYLETRKAHSPDIELLQRLAERLRPRAAILDAGCGAGVPVTSQLAKHFNVTGVDISIAQLRLARDLGHWDLPTAPSTQYVRTMQSFMFPEVFMPTFWLSFIGCWHRVA
jgi:SAM-dependent methyltransferase